MRFPNSAKISWSMCMNYDVSPCSYEKEDSSFENYEGDMFAQRLVKGGRPRRVKYEQQCRLQGENVAGGSGNLRDTDREHAI